MVMLPFMWPSRARRSSSVSPDTRCPTSYPKGVFQVVDADRGEFLRCRSQETFLVLLSAVVAFAVAGVAAVPFQVPAWAVGMVMEVPD